jgi:hypothetical protein
VIAVHPVDRGDRAEAADVLRAVRQLEVREPVYLDAGNAVQRGLVARVYPTFVLIDRKGNVRYRYSGALGVRGQRGLEQELDRLLAER